jgi:P2-related tail formation protein
LSVERIGALEARLEIYERNQREMIQKLNDIHIELARYKGMLGAVALIITGLGVLLQFAKDWLLK